MWAWPELGDDARLPLATAAGTVTLDDGIVGLVAAAVIADPAFGAAIDDRLRAAIPASVVAPALEPGPAPGAEHIPEL
ncbi:MAG: hypothetical protein AB1736_10210 [Chloroflexota bacterium]